MQLLVRAFPVLAGKEMQLRQFAHEIQTNRSAEVADFGLQTTLVEPGTIRTDFGASGVLSAELDAYREGPVGSLRRMATAGYAAPGDPAKMAKAIVDTFDAENAPPRLALGPDVYGYIKAALTSRLEQAEAHKSLTMSTDCDDVATR